MERLEVSGAVRPIYGSLGVKRLSTSSGGMISTGQFRTAHSRTCPSATVFFTNLTRSGLGSEMPVLIVVDTFVPSYSRVVFLVFLA